MNVIATGRLHRREAIQIISADNGYIVVVPPPHNANHFSDQELFAINENIAGKTPSTGIFIEPTAKDAAHRVETLLEQLKTLQETTYGKK